MKTPESLYEMLQSDENYNSSYYNRLRRRGMVLTPLKKNGIIRYLIDELNKKAYEFMDENAVLLTVEKKDIDWESLKRFPYTIIEEAESLKANDSFSIRTSYLGEGRWSFAEWYLGSSSNEEICLTGVIDRTGKVVRKFRYYDTSGETGKCYNLSWRNDGETIRMRMTDRLYATVPNEPFRFRSNVLQDNENEIFFWIWDSRVHEYTDHGLADFSFLTFFPMQKGETILMIREGASDYHIHSIIVE